MGISTQDTSVFDYTSGNNSEEEGSTASISDMIRAVNENALDPKRLCKLFGPDGQFHTQVVNLFEAVGLDFSASPSRVGKVLKHVQESYTTSIFHRILANKVSKEELESTLHKIKTANAKRDQEFIKKVEAMNSFEAKVHFLEQSPWLYTNDIDNHIGEWVKANGYQEGEERTLKPEVAEGLARIAKFVDYKDVKDPRVLSKAVQYLFNFQNLEITKALLERDDIPHVPVEVYNHPDISVRKLAAEKKKGIVAEVGGVGVNLEDLYVFKWPKADGRATLIRTEWDTTTSEERKPLKDSPHLKVMTSFLLQSPDDEVHVALAEKIPPEMEFLRDVIKEDWGCDEAVIKLLERDDWLLEKPKGLEEVNMREIDNAYKSWLSEESLQILKKRGEGNTEVGRLIAAKRERDGKNEDQIRKDFLKDLDKKKKKN